MLTSVRLRTVPLICGLIVGIVGAGVVGWAATSPRDGGSGARVRAEISGWRWAPSDKPPKRERADDTAEEPAFAPAEDQATEQPREETRKEVAPPPEPAPLPKEPNADDVLARAEVLGNGVALPPLEAPPEIRAIFEAGNTIARHPYKWGGGHGKWQDNGYDCSGSVSYALAAAGLLSAPQASGPLMRWGRPGKGKWLTIYSNPGHVFMVVAGVRFDTSAAKRGKTGSRFTNEMRPTGGYAVRHWPGL